MTKLKKLKSDRRGRRLGPSQPSQGLPRPSRAPPARLQDSGEAVPRYSGHVHIVRADGLQYVRHLHHIRRHGRSAATRASKQGHQGRRDSRGLARTASR